MKKQQKRMKGPTLLLDKNRQQLVSIIYNLVEFIMNYDRMV